MNFEKAANETIKLYNKLGWKSLFAKIRFWDAPYKELERLVPKEGLIVDLGCGEGLFSNLLAIMSPKRKIFGVDIDKSRIDEADRGLKNTKFVHGDVTKKDVPKADVILMVHLLHHLDSYTDQEELLKECKNKLKDKGKLIIAEAEPKISIKYFLSWGTDHFLVPWLFEKRFYSPIFFRRSNDWVKYLKSLGFKCQVISAEKNKPFSHIIFYCKL